jgi:DNA-binding NarL/FixJ family response regulator
MWHGQQPAKGSEGCCVSYSILIVDDNAAMRRSIRSYIEQSGEWHICGEAENGQAAIEKVLELHPDVALLDLQMPVMNGLEAARQIAVIAPKTAMLMFTMHTSAQLVEEARAAGIKGVLSKTDSLGERLLASLKHICAPPSDPASEIAV